MGKALMGTYAAPRTLAMLDEIRALRLRIAELETALAEAEAARETRVLDDAVVTLDEPATATR